MIITIDGPMASGKSSVAQALARNLGCWYLNTGFLYRAIAWGLIHGDGHAFESLEHPDLSQVHDLIGDFTYRYDHVTGARMLYRGDDVTNQLKIPEIDQGSSIVSAVPEVRILVLDWLRRISQSQNCIADGRDAGSVIFPHAEYKFFLTAKPEIRAERWRASLAKRGIALSADEALSELNARDGRDSKRAIAPLIVPEGARVVDNSGLTLEQTIELFMSFLG